MTDRFFTMSRPKTDKAAITEAFEILRREVFFAAESFHCCQKCAWKDVPANAVRVVFYHEQDARSFTSEGRLFDPLFLSHNGGAGALRVCEVLRGQGFRVQWEGDDRVRIAVLPGREVRA